jgi:hypothetical protein
VDPIVSEKTKTVIAALLLIAIAVAAAILLYVFSVGLLGSLGVSNSQLLVVDSYKFPTTGPLALTIRNVGPKAVDLGEDKIFINGVEGTLGTSCPSKLTPTQSCDATISLSSYANLVPGAAYPMKIVFPDDGAVSYSIVFGGSS